jgi:hypothetical protein
MRMTLLAVVLGATVCTSATATTAASAPAGTVRIGFRHCGTITGLGARFELLSHRARCRVARRVMGGVLAGKGEVRGDPALGLQVAIDGWLCWGQEGGFRCRLLAPDGKLAPFDFQRPGPLFEACPVGSRIPNWAVRACVRVRRNGVRPPG